jgi:hypothetical protein
MSYLYTPPTYRMVATVERSLRYGVSTSTLVYRMGGQWTNVQDPGMDAPVVANVDVDASGLKLYFDRPTVVPDTLFAELSGVAPTDPSWTPGSLTHLS